jgi:hypothetical protein
MTTKKYKKRPLRIIKNKKITKIPFIKVNKKKVYLP